MENNIYNLLHFRGCDDTNSNIPVIISDGNESNSLDASDITNNSAS